MDPIWLMLLLQVVLIALNAVFACAEIAVVSANDVKIEKLAKEGDKRAKKLVSLTEQPSKFLSTIQVAITLSGFLGSAFAAENFSEPIVELILKTGIGISEGTLNTIVVILITLILSYFTLVFGELVPKRVAMRKTEETALALAGLVYGLSKVFKPIVSFLTLSTNGVLRLMKIDPNAEDDEVSEEDIKIMVDAGNELGTIDNTEKEFIQNVFEFDDLTADEVCTHRTEVVILWLDEFEEWDNIICQSYHSIYPICDETVDKVVGLLDVKDYFRLSDKSLDNIMKNAVEEPYFVPESVKLDVLFTNFKKDKKQFAIVLDEHGGTTGVITINDLLEELVGDFNYDENYDDGIEIEQISDDTWKITGNPLINDIEDVMGIEISDDDADTLNGIVLTELGTIPDDGSSFDIETDILSIKVTDVKAHKVQSAIIQKKEAKKDDAQTDDDTAEK